MNAIKLLEKRGFLSQCTNRPELEKLFDQETILMYVGVDPTASSLHVGHMVPYFAMANLQALGHKPIVVLGCGTAMIGDPSGKSEMRKILPLDEIRKNGERIKIQLSRILDFNKGKAIMVNNHDWLGNLNYIDFLRDIGSHFSVNRMLSFEAYKARLETGLSFIEFNYQLLQSYDYLMLYREHGCKLQMGGDDQWGNIVAGMELIRRVEGGEVFGLTVPLITTADGKKMGKSEKGAVFLDPELVSPYEFFQFWRNTADPDVGRFLRLFTFLEEEQINELESLEGSEINKAKEMLAYEQTQIIHGKEQAEAALTAAKSAFATQGNSGDRNAIPSLSISGSEIDHGIDALELFARTGLCTSRAEARRLIEQGGARINEEKVSKLNQKIIKANIKDGEILLRAGKKRLFRIVVE